MCNIIIIVLEGLEIHALFFSFVPLLFLFAVFGLQYKKSIRIQNCFPLECFRERYQLFFLHCYINFERICFLIRSPHTVLSVKIRCAENAKNDLLFVFRLDEKAQRYYLELFLSNSPRVLKTIFITTSGLN